MTEPRPEAAARPRILEAGNLVFLYRPVRAVLHPRSSDQIERAFFALFPDDQSHHQNRLVALAHGYYPPIIPDQDLPEERGWAFVARVDRNPRAVVAASEQDVSAATAGRRPRARVPTRIAGSGRYAIARHDDRTYLAYALHRPAQLGPAQHALLLERTGSYVVVVKEPFMPSDLNLRERPAYPEALGEMFDGHGSIPVDPTDFLDYRWTQIFLVGAQQDLKAESGVDLKPKVENQAVKEALQFLYDEAKQVEATQHLDVFRPMRQGELE